jgi:predicted AlkP superfamily pyrophosphatase or phosphodiesterase
MTPIKKLTALLSLFLLLIAGCTVDETTEKEKKALFIILDGISADILEMIDTPNLDRIAGEGSYSRGWLGGEEGSYSESPTVSAVGYNHLLTGTWSNKHNVYGNSIENPNYNYWSIFRLFDHQYPDRQTAIYSSWLDNRTKLVGDGLPEAGSIYIDIHYDGFDVDTVAFPHDYGYVQRIDEHVSEQPAQSIMQDAPDLAWVYLWYPDDTGHRYGEVEEHFESIRVADSQIGRIYDAVQSRMENHNEDWMFVVTTDHGRSLPDGKGHGGHSERERTIWIITNKDTTNRYFEAVKPAIVDIYPTISRHLSIDIPADLQRELDGIPFTGDISLSSPTAEYNEETGEIELSWNAWEQNGNVKIHVTTTNNFADGGNDQYQLLGEFPLIGRSASVDVSSMPSDFYKVVIEGPHNSVNRWVVVD